MEAPVAAKKPKELTIHGDTRIDNYYWLRERENPEVIAYLEAENAYRESLMKGTEQFQEDLYEEIVGRIKQNDESVPYKENGYYYYTRYEEGGEYPIFCRKKESLEAEEEIMANVNEMAKGYDYYQVGGGDRYGEQEEVYHLYQGPRDRADAGGPDSADHRRVYLGI